MQQTPAQIFFRFLRFGLLAWGGPVAQIAMIKKELVDEEKWVSKEQFNRALAVYQVLPGPEAHELCVYFGMKAGGRLGGFLAGLAFMLPGFLLMLLLTWFYVRFGIRSPHVQVIFSGIQAAVVALIAFAVYRIGKHAIVSRRLLILTIACGIVFFAGVNFLVVLLIAGFVYAFWQKNRVLPVATLFIFLSAITAFVVYKNIFREKKAIVAVAASSQRPTQSKAAVFVTGLKGGLLTFGGAYTAIPFIQEDAVIKNKWMTQEQFLDGIALSGVLPAPLIIFSTFVGYFGDGWIGALLITIGIFLPAFSFTLIGHHLMEKLIANTALHNFLDGVTAGVVGLIGATAMQLLFSVVQTIPAILIFLSALFVMIKFKSKYAVILIILGAGLAGLFLHFMS